MNSTLQKARRAQIDSALSQTREALLPIPPKGGWIRAIREAMGLSLQDLADKLGISKTAAVHIEKSEANDRITLARLRSAAAALNCRVHIIVLPEIPLTEAAEAQAVKQAMEIVSRANHTMALEDQAVYSTSDESLIAETAQEILAKGRLNWD